MTLNLRTHRRFLATPLWPVRFPRYEAEIAVQSIDAICVNEDDTGKIDHGIVEMPTILSMFSRVIFWLGSETVVIGSTSIYLPEKERPERETHRLGNDGITGLRLH